MLSAEHRKPLAAFVVVFAVACAIMGQGLRQQVVEVLVGSGAPDGLIAAIAPEMVLSQSLDKAVPVPRPTARKVAAGPDDQNGPVSPSQNQVRTDPGTSAPVQAAPRQSTRPTKAAGRPSGAGAQPAVTGPAAVPAAPLAPVASPTTPAPVPSVTPSMTGPRKAFTATGGDSTGTDRGRARGWVRFQGHTGTTEPTDRVRERVRQHSEARAARPVSHPERGRAARPARPDRPGRSDHGDRPARVDHVDRRPPRVDHVDRRPAQVDRMDRRPAQVARLDRGAHDHRGADRPRYGR